jgi:hypothetical protein
VSQAVGTDQTLARLRGLLAEEGEAIAPVLTAAPGEEVVGPLVLAAAAGRSDGPELALVTESILEGYLLHYGSPRLVDTDDDDLRLLAGDHLYALGLSRLAALGDLDAVRALADLIALCARTHAEGGESGAAADEHGSLWVLTALAVGAGPWPAYEQLIDATRRGAATGEHRLTEVAERAAALGVGLQAQAALIAFGSAVADRPTPSNSGNFRASG